MKRIMPWIIVLVVLVLGVPLAVLAAEQTPPESRLSYKAGNYKVAYDGLAPRVTLAAGTDQLVADFNLCVNARRIWGGGRKSTISARRRLRRTRGLAVRAGGGGELREHAALWGGDFGGVPPGQPAEQRREVGVEPGPGPGTGAAVDG